MGRKLKFTVEYFPHFVGDSKTKRILNKYWGNDGYAFWFKLLELLCNSDGHYLDLSDAVAWEDFLVYMSVPEDVANDILDKLILLHKVDRDLWYEHRIIWCETLIDNISHVYDKRSTEIPKKPSPSSPPSPQISGVKPPEQTFVTEQMFARNQGFPERKNKKSPENENSRSGNPTKTPLSGISGVENPQSKVKESKVKESKVKESKGVRTDAPPEGSALASSSPESSEVSLSQAEMTSPSDYGAQLALSEEKRHKRGQFGWVRLTDAEYTRLIDDHGAQLALHYIAYVDESAQQTGNKNKWKDWNLTVRKAIRQRWGGGPPKTQENRFLAMIGGLDDT